MTLFLTFSALAIGFVIGTFLALGRVYGPQWLRLIVQGYEKTLIGIPILVLMVLFYIGVPGLFRFADQSAALAAAVFCLGIRSSAYQSQIFRGAILSVGEGQMEAALSIGMTTTQATRRIILPQAFRLSLPGWSNEYAIVIKDTSYAIVIGVMEMIYWSNAYRAAYPSLFSVVVLIIAIIYFIFTYPVTRIMGEQMTEKLERLGLGGR